MVDKKEELISSDKEIVNRYKEYFDQLLNSEPSANQGKHYIESYPSSHSVENEVIEPSKVEIDMVIMSLKNNKFCRRREYAENF